jgi:hypothetical protein
LENVSGNVFQRGRMSLKKRNLFVEGFLMEGLYDFGMQNVSDVS